MGVVRKSWIGKGPLFTEYGVILRSVRADQSQAVWYSVAIMALCVIVVEPYAALSI